MRVCFLHARQDRAYAEAMLASLRDAMPRVSVLMMTDADEAPIGGCEVQRIPWDGKNWAVWRMSHLAALPAGEWVSVDTDMVIQHDLAKVFAFPFDVAVTQRDGPILDTTGRDITKHMPYNAGVVWWRNPDFWKAAHIWIMQQPEPVQKWYGDQLALAALTPKYNTLKLHCDNWNHSPMKATEDVSKRFIVHYKGSRKPWMLGNTEHKAKVTLADMEGG
jgi:hypothetical protein